MEVCNELNFNEVEEDEIYSYRIIQSGIIPNLLQFISHSNPSVILSALRALKNIFSTPSAPRTSVIEEKNIIENLENLLKHENEKIIENAAKFIANLCCTKFLPPSTILSLIPPQDSLSIPTFSTFPNEIIGKRSALESLFKIQNKLANSNIISHLLHIVALNGTSFFLFFPFFPLSFPLSFPPLFPFPFLLSFSSVIFLCSSTFHYFPLALFSFFVFPPSSFDSITSRVLLFTHFTPPIILYSFTPPPLLLQYPLQYTLQSRFFISLFTTPLRGSSLYAPLHLYRAPCIITLTCLYLSLLIRREGEGEREKGRGSGI